MITKSDKEIIDFLILNEDHFVYILNEFNNNYSDIPKNIYFKTYCNDENKIESLIAYKDTGHYYIYLKNKYIKSAGDFIKNNINKIFSIYGEKSVIENLLNEINLIPRNLICYYVMKLKKENYIPLMDNLKHFTCLKCNIDHYNELKELQYLYHKEEVYDNNSYYPYNAEMNDFKNILKTKLIYGVFTSDIIFNNKTIAVSKANTNGETPWMYQLGGIFTIKGYRKIGLSKLCLTKLLNDIFLNSNKNSVILYVKQNNKPAINLYHKFGFKIIFESLMCYLKS